MISARSAIGLLTVFTGGVVFWGSFNWAMEATNTESFCVSCHEMKNNVYQEYKNTVHYTNSTGVRATCPDCHVPKEWWHKVMRKLRATNELYHSLVGSIDTPEKFNMKRHTLAQSVWASMRATDSRECRNCHSFKFMEPALQSALARNVHQLSLNSDKTCIDCHKGIAHALPTEFDRDVQINEQHKQFETDNIECSLCHEGMAQAPPGDGWDD